MEASFSELDWNQRWQEAWPPQQRKKDPKEYWNTRAPSFASHAKHSSYVDDFLQRLAPHPDWSVLDVGCGAGTLAIPLTGRVKSITALDISETMLSLLMEECRKERITSIHPHNVSWEDDWDACGVQEHDVVIASRSLTPLNLRAALQKLNDKARQRVVLTSIVGSGPFDPRIFAALHRKRKPQPDYIYIVNMLHQMGINAEVSFIVNRKNEQRYDNLEEAVNSVRWKVPDLTEKEENLLADFFKKNLVEAENGWKMREPHTVRWAYISWEKE